MLVGEPSITETDQGNELWTGSKEEGCGQVKAVDRKGAASQERKRRRTTRWAKRMDGRQVARTAGTMAGPMKSAMAAVNLICAPINHRTRTKSGRISDPATMAYRRVHPIHDVQDAASLASTLWIRQTRHCHGCLHRPSGGGFGRLWRFCWIPLEQISRADCGWVEENQSRIC